MSAVAVPTKKKPVVREPRKPVYTAIGIAILAVMLFPVYWMLNVSLQPAGGAVATPLIPPALDFGGYATAIEDQGANLVTSLIVAFGAVIFSLAVATPAAYALAQFKFGNWVSVILFVVLITQMIPGIVVANALYGAYSDLGMLNSHLGLILADSAQGIPFSIILMRAFMLGIPTSIVEAAYVDGAGPVRAFISVVLPISRNALITSGLFTFLFAWGDFLFAVTLTTNESVRPITYGIYTYLSGQVQNWSPVMATAVMSSLPAIALLLLAQRYIAAGVTGGAVKS
ncbi:MAG: carbohydrate ABC transporter permease [Beutenbergiaceae bacterium]